MTAYDDAMRTIVDLPKEQLDALAELCARERLSRAELIRRAGAKYLKQARGTAGEDAFGLWRKKKIDSLPYEDRLRGEWDGR